MQQQLAQSAATGVLEPAAMVSQILMRNAVSWVTLWLTGLAFAVTALWPGPAAALPCPMPDLGGAEILQWIQQIGRPTLTQPQVPSRWAALVPQQLGLTVHGGERASLGWTDTLTTSTDRFSQYASWGLSVRFAWDLKDLLRPTPRALQPTTEQRLQWALHTESLASRLAQPLRQLRTAQLLASTAQRGDPICAEAQADAEVALLVLQAVRMAAQPLRNTGF